MPNSNPRARYVALARPPRGRAWVEYVGEEGESRERVEAQALASLEALCHPYPHYGTVEILAYSAAKRSYPWELARYERYHEQEQARAAAGAAACGSQEGS